MEPIEYIRALRRYRIVIAAAMLVAVGAAWVTRAIDSGERSGSYQATTVLIVSYDTGGQFFNPQGSLSDPRTVAVLVTLDPIPGRVADRLGYDGKPEELAAAISATVDEATGLLNINATASEPGRAKELADAFSKEMLVRLAELKQSDYAAQIASLEAQIASVQRQIRNAGAQELGALGSRLAQLRGQLDSLTSYPPEPGFEILSTGEAQPVVSVGIQAPRSFPSRALIAALIGLLAGVVIALILVRFDTRIRTRQAAEEGFSLPVLAEIPVLPRGGRDGVVTALQPASRPAEAFRLLGAELVSGIKLNGSGRSQGDGARSKPPQTLLVTSGGPSEGKTTVVANLAASLAETGRKVLIISCDFHRPNVHRLFRVPNDLGLTDALQSGNGGPVLSGFIRETSFDDVHLVPSGPAPRSSGELLASDKMRDALGEARSLADVVLIDTPPILVASDATYLLPQVDSVLVVARAGRTKTELAARTSELLERLGAPVTGVVLTRAAEVPIPRGYRLYYRAKPPQDGVGDFPNYRVTEKQDSV